MSIYIQFYLRIISLISRNIKQIIEIKKLIALFQHQILNLH